MAHPDDGGGISNSGLKIRPLFEAALASARELVLWMLEAGYTPQHLDLRLNRPEDLIDRMKREVLALQEQGMHDLAVALQQRAGLPESKSLISGLQHYARGDVLVARLKRLDQERGVQEAARSGTTEDVLTTAASLLEANQVNTAIHLLCSHADEQPYSPEIARAFAKASEVEEDWAGAIEHWSNTLLGNPQAATAVEAQRRLNELVNCEAHQQQRVVMEFDHLLFEESFLTHTGPNPLPFFSPSEAAAAFWKHDASAEALLSPEINPLLWSDFRRDSSLQQAAHYWLVQKLFHGRCLLEAISKDGGVPIEAMARRCRSSFNAMYYLSQRQQWKKVTAETALNHYLKKGWTEGLNPNAFFNTNAALEQEPLLRSFAVNPFYFDQCINNGGEQNKLLNATVQRFGSGIVVGKAQQKDSKSSHVKLFTKSTYFDPKFTWFTASPPGQNNSLELHWVIPDFGTGGGGHMTIFRMVKHLERQGHKITLWVVDPVRSKHAADLKDDVLKYYQPIRAKVLPLDTSFFFSSGDAVIATSWQTVEPVQQATGFKERFYFIQDYEPFFYARGSQAVMAEETYNSGLACICASPWLHQIMRDRFDAWSRSFWLAYEPQIYNCTPEHLESRRSRQENSNHVFNLAVYARRFTERRCVEMAFAALEQLDKQRKDVVVHLFGDRRPPEDLTIAAIHHGVLDAEQLANLYRFCDLGLSLSATNYSLLPQEMMATGLPVVDLAVESTEAIYPKGVIALATPSAEGLANTINSLLNAPETMQQQANDGLAWVNQFSWEKAGQAVEQALIDRLSEVDAGRTAEGIAFEKTSSTESDRPRFKASVVIPTYNAGDILKEVLIAIQQQQTPWDFQCVLIDSASSDDTLEQLEKFAKVQPNVSVHQIEKEEFQHGHTRNRGVAWSDAEFVAFLTQDAIPADQFWLYNLVTALESQPSAAGAFGRHIAHDNTTSLIRDELEQHFNGLDEFPKALNLSSNRDLICADDQGWRKVLHFYSDNNSCLRKSVWLEIPLPCVPFGEDQLWAEAIIRHGYSKVYAKDAVVKHSHHYSPAQTYERSKIEADFFNTCFGHTMHQSRLAMDAAISADCKAASTKAIKSKTTSSATELDHKYKSIIAKHAGWRHANKNQQHVSLQDTSKD